MNNNVRYTLTIHKTPRTNINIINNILSRFLNNNIINNIINFLGPINPIMLIVLCNPASINGHNITGQYDHTIKLIKNNIDLLQFDKIIIINVIPLVSLKLEDIECNDSNFLSDIQNINKNTIRDVLRNNNDITKILFACGQHFTTTKINNLMREYYKRCFLEVYELLKNYKEMLFCLGFTTKTINKIRLPCFPTNRNINNFIIENTVQGQKYKLIPYI